MVRTKEQQTIEYKCIRGGNGEAEMHKILNTPEELYGKGRMFNHMILAPGDNEIFYFLKGSGLYNDNGTSVRVYPGDTAVCSSGEFHSLANDGYEPLEFIALILY